MKTGSSEELFVCQYIWQWFSQIKWWKDYSFLSQSQWGSQCLSSDSETAGAVKHYEQRLRAYLSM